MTKGFKEYLQNTKDEFVTAVWELNLSPAQRAPMENMILAFDQCRHKLEAQLQQPVVMQAEGSDVSEGAAVGQRSVGQNGSGGLYCVSSDSLVYGKSCDKWCGDKNCWRGEAPSEGVLH